MESSSTTTVTGYQSTLRNVLLLPRKWPNPINSVDLAGPTFTAREASILTSTNRYRFWSVKGPALDAYRSVESNIRDLLQQRDDLSEGQDECGLPWSIACYMVGKKPEKTSPCIVVKCPSKTFCQRATRAIKDTNWWTTFTQTRPGFRFIHLQKALRIVRLGIEGSVEPGEDLFVYTSFPFDSLYDLPLYISKSESDVGVYRQPDATMGGVVLLNSQLFGTTVAHPFRNPSLEDASTGAQRIDEMDESEFSFIYDSDEEDDSEQDTGTNDEISNVSSTPLVDMETQTIPQLVTADQVFVFIGKLRFLSNGLPEDELDWALFDLPEHPHFRIGYRFSNGYTTNVGLQGIKYTHSMAGLFSTARLQAAKYPNALPSVDRQQLSTSIVVGDWAGSIVQGTMSACAELVRLPGSRHILSLHLVSLKQRLVLGDCGKWVMGASDGLWYGHIVAGIPGTGTAYIAASSHIWNDIEEKTGMKSNTDLMSNFRTLSPIPNDFFNIYMPFDTPVKDKGFQIPLASSSVSLPAFGKNHHYSSEASPLQYRSNASQRPFWQPLSSLNTFTNTERAELLMNILRSATSDLPHVLMQLIHERQIVPKWDEIPLPQGRSLSSCQSAFEEMSHMVGDVASSTKFDKAVLRARVLQPRPRNSLSPENAQISEDVASSPHLPASQPKPLDTRPRKRGRPSKMEAEERILALAAEEKAYQPKKRKIAPLQLIAPSYSPAVSIVTSSVKVETQKAIDSVKKDTKDTKDT